MVVSKRVSTMLWLSLYLIRFLRLDPAIADAYGLGILLHCLFNPDHPLPATLQPPHSPPVASSRGAIPTTLFPLFKRLLNPNHKARLSPKSFLEAGTGAKGDGSAFFTNNTLVQICSGLDGFALASEAEKMTLLRYELAFQVVVPRLTDHVRSLKDSTSSFPPEFASQRVLPSLMSALDFGGASATILLPLVLQLGKNLSPAEQTTAVVTPIVKLYASTDRGIRMSLLDTLPEYADKLETRMVVDKVWPHLVSSNNYSATHIHPCQQTGFTDTVAIIREATVRSISLIAPKVTLLCYVKRTLANENRSSTIEFSTTIFSGILQRCRWTQSLPLGPTLAF